MRESVGGGIGGGLDLDRLPPSPLPIRGHQELRTGVFEAESHGFGRETAEHQRMHRADAGAGESDDDRLDEHGEVDDHPVTGLDPEALEGVGRLGDPSLEVSISDRHAVASLPLEVERHLLATTGDHMTVDAVDRHVQSPAVVPAGGRHGQLAVLIAHRRPPLERRRPRALPLESVGGAVPEADRIGGGDRRGFGADVRLCGEGRIRWKRPLFDQTRLVGGRRDGTGHLHSLTASA